MYRTELTGVSPLLRVWRGRTQSSGMFEANQVAGKRGPVSVEGHPETGDQLQSRTVSPTPAQLIRQSKLNRQQKPHTLTCQNATTCKEPLVGKKSLLKCLIGGYPATVLFDSGSQVSIIDQEWAGTHIPNYTLRPFCELLEGELGVYAVTGHAVRYSGWVELTVNLAGNDNPNLTIQAPFLVSQLPLPQPLLGANVLG